MLNFQKVDYEESIKEDSFSITDFSGKVPKVTDSRKFKQSDL